jgi:hypothetical protein
VPIKNKYPPKVVVAVTVNAAINALPGVNPSKVRKAIVETGEIPSYQVGIHKMVLIVDLQSYVRSHPRCATEA